jgi:hypothetical protein
VLTEVVKQLHWIERLEEHRGVQLLPFGGEQIGVARDYNNGQVWLCWFAYRTSSQPLDAPMAMSVIRTSGVEARRYCTAE